LPTDFTPLEIASRTMKWLGLSFTDDDDILYPLPGIIFAAS
jgi:hypothetical protein